MKLSCSKIAYLLSSLLYVFSANVAANPPSTASGLDPKPLFLGGNAEPNVMFDIDDSGSMDWETLFKGTNSGLLYWSNASQSFVQTNDSGELNVSGNRSYGYMFPNGTAFPYNGRRMYSDGNGIRAIPPVRSYAFARSSDYNQGYYDPTVVYSPWPSYGGYTFTNSVSFPLANPAIANAAFEPMTTLNTAGSLNLIANKSSSSAGETFRIYDGMACDDDVTVDCGDDGDDVEISYYPATYYVKDDTASTYTVTNPSFGNFTTINSVLLELEDGTITPSMWSVDNDSTASSASAGGYIGTNDSDTDVMSTPTASAQVAVAFNMTGTANIWIRRWFYDGAHDSFWVNLRNHDTTDMTLAAANAFVDDGAGQSWIQWRDGHGTTNAGWVWERLAQVVLDGSSHQLSIMLRESGTYADAVLVTTNLTDTPSGIVSLSGSPFITRSCDDVAAFHYQEFASDPTRFSGVDAIGPDGGCLRKVEIKSTDPNYTTTAEYESDLTNFSNWFTYYRRRHQAMRGGVAAALEGVSGIRTGMFWFNNRVSVNMGSFDSAEVATPATPGHVETFLKNHYERVTAAGTPTRGSLVHAGDEYMRDSTASGAAPPITASCQRNFTLLFTDGYANDEGITGIGNWDTGQGEPYEDTDSHTLADIAMKYYDTTLRSATDFTTGRSPVKTSCTVADPDPQLDCNRNLHMNTYAVGLNAKGNIFGVTHNTVADAFVAGNSPSWVTPDVDSGAVQADDLYHAAINGRGEIFNASSPDGLKTALQSVVTEILEDASEGGASSVAFNTSTLRSSSVVMTASFNAAKWSGELEAINLDPQSGALTSSAWLASEKLDAQLPITRKIFTYNGTVSKPFEWGNLTTAQKNDLKTNPSGGADNDLIAQARLNFIRGDRSLEDAAFRSRDSALGDIVHSSPVFVGAPEMNYPDELPFGDATNLYSEFKESKADRAPVVYVGANDGMLHGFLTEDTGSIATADLTEAGSEVFAYIPSSVYSTDTTKGLHYLTDKNYSHRNYVDGTPAVADVFTNGSWRTVLVAALRGGGKSVFALDVTEPANYKIAAKNESHALWEFNSDNSNPDMGYIVGKPIIAMMSNGQWAAVFGNGYGSTSGATKLYIINMSNGSIMKEIDTDANNGGLSAPALADIDGDGKVDRIYAGDLGGNMWAFDVSSTNTNSWDSDYKQGATPKPLFTATNASSEVQPISSSPVLALNTEVEGTNSNAPNVLVLFGTGQYLVGGDIANNDVQSFYTVWDSGTDELTRANLEVRTVTNITGGFRETSGDDVVWSTKSGWYMDFNIADDAGERIALSPNVRSNVVFFNTLIPAALGDLCAAGGRGYLMSVELNTGETPESAVFDSNGDNLVDADDNPYSGQLMNNIPMDSGFLGDRQYTPTNIGTVSTRAISVDDAVREGRLSWLELFTD